MTCSNYTTRIESDVLDRKFVYSMQTNQCFAAYSKVKKDVRSKPVPFVDKHTLIYFEHDFRGSASLDRVYNIDLKSAYASILYKEGYISKDTFEYLGRLPKHDRLVSVGMLASKKKTFGFNRAGQINVFESSVSDLENFFYFAVQKTFDIMQNLKVFLKDSYLFTWVDGIYFKPDMRGLIQCEDYLRNLGYRYSEEILTDWQIRMVKGAVRLTFLKEGKIKMFNLPAKESEFALIMAEAMRERPGKEAKEHQAVLNLNKVISKQNSELYKRKKLRK